MKYIIELSNRFKKSFKKLNRQEQEIFKEVVSKFANDEVLELKYKDHALVGNYKDFRECLLKPDLLLIYKKEQETLVLYCLYIGSHSRLFG